MSAELIALLKWGWTGLVAWYWYDKQRNDKILEAIVSKQARTPTFEDMEKAISKAVDPVREDQREVLMMTREMNTTLNQLTRDLAVLNAKFSLTRQQQDSEK